MGILLRFVRKVTRFALSVGLWMHALFLLRFPVPSLSPIVARLGFNVGETSILFLIICFSILASYGLGNIIVDLLYVYFFPFILIYILVRLLWQVVHFVFKLTTLGHNVGLEKKPINLPQLITAPQSEKQKTNATIGRPKFSWGKLGKEVVRPFRQFTLLWCLLLLLTSKTTLLWIALVVLAMSLGRTLLIVVAFILVSSAHYSYI